MRESICMAVGHAAARGSSAAREETIFTIMNVRSEKEVLKRDCEKNSNERHQITTKPDGEEAGA